MNNAKINNEIELTYPDGFNQMGEEELSRYFGTAADRWGVYDAENHTILAVGWRKAGFFANLADEESCMIGIESRMRRSLLNYQRLSSYQPKIGKKKYYAIRFEYRVKDAALVQLADLVVIKYKKKFYTIHYITRKNNAIEMLPAFEEVLKSIKLV